MTEERRYSQKELIDIVTCYSKTSDLVGNARGLGTEALDPMNGDILGVLKATRDEFHKTVPKEIREQYPGPLNELESQISYMERHAFSPQTIQALEDMLNR